MHFEKKFTAFINKQINKQDRPRTMIQLFKRKTLVILRQENVFMFRVKQSIIYRYENVFFLRAT